MELQPTPITPEEKEAVIAAKGTQFEAMTSKDAAKIRAYLATPRGGKFDSTPEEVAAMSEEQLLQDGESWAASMTEEGITTSAELKALLENPETRWYKDSPTRISIEGKGKMSAVLMESNQDTAGVWH